LEVSIGFEPCLWIGGDYANVLPAPDGRVLLAVADASGKGVAAAMIASGVHSIVHSSIRAGSKLEDMIHSLNQYLLESTDRQSFVTMIGALVDPRTGKTICVNAGHPPMLVIEPNGNIMEMRYGNNPPLGVMPMTVELDTTELQPGHLLVLFTDGVSELRDPNGRMLGLDGIKSRLAEMYADEPRASLNDISARLKQTLDQIRGSASATDDRTFLLARREAR
jgi:serine phosphatase RsbU (regulator of sigma subunit)